jgi:hypothetical protein
VTIPDYRTREARVEDLLHDIRTQSERQSAFLHTIAVRLHFIIVLACAVIGGSLVRSCTT